MLPFGPPLAPMLGELADVLPEGPEWWFEPKWDGFRVLAFLDGDTLDLRSRDDRPLLRYFPELEAPLKAALPSSAVVDGEIYVVRGGALDFETLQMRLHPAASRVGKLAAEVPAGVVLWDLLAEGAQDLRALAFRERRERLEACVRPNGSVWVTPGTTDPARAEEWFDRFEGAGLDGVMAKRLDETYQPGKRVLRKVKHVRTVDAAVLGFRWHKGGEGTEVGSLVLGLFDRDGSVRPIGVASSFTKAERKRLVERLAPLREGATGDHPWASFGEAVKKPDQRSRWNADRDLTWVPLRLEAVVEVTTTQHSATRLRHPAHVVRWRADKPPRECSLDQLGVVAPALLSALVGSRSPT